MSKYLNSILSRMLKVWYKSVHSWRISFNWLRWVKRKKLKVNKRSLKIWSACLRRILKSNKTIQGYHCAILTLLLIGLRDWSMLLKNIITKLNKINKKLKMKDCSMLMIKLKSIWNCSWVILIRFCINSIWPNQELIKGPKSFKNKH